jgi:UDP-N-acetylglucosamine 2-epimerase (non-hydrolysing)
VADTSEPAPLPVSFSLVTIKYLSVIGTRPQLMKLAPLCDAFAELKQDHGYIDTGQHYDASLSLEVQKDLGLPDPIINLSVGSHSHGKQTAIIMERLELEISQIRPDCVLVYGDTNSTLAATLVAVKMDIPVAHVEAGLRSFNRKMPEELNRVATDHLSDILFCPTDTALQNLRLEGLESRSSQVGDVMVDLIHRDLNRIKTQELTSQYIDEPFLVATIHRVENTDFPTRLSSIFTAIAELPFRVLLFAHPRLTKKIDDFNLKLPPNVVLINPVPHNLLLSYVLRSQGVVTDSGGLQKESYILRVPCTTIRNETEWPETLFDDWNVIVRDIGDLRSKLNIERNKTHVNRFGDGKAAVRIVRQLIEKV